MSCVKKAQERADFERFCRLVNLELAVCSIEQPEPPHPDIVCLVGGEPRRFELTAITEPAIERRVSEPTPLNDVSLPGISYSVGLCDIASAICRKSGKAYSDGADIDLVLHQRSTPLDEFWWYSEEEKCRELRAPVEKSPFARVWIADFEGGKFSELRTRLCS